MAAVVLADITAVLNLIYMDRLADTIRRDVLLPNLLGVAPDRNSQCTWSVKTSGRNTAKVSSGADVVAGDFSNHERYTAALTWARYESFAAVDGLAQAVAAANGPGTQGSTIDVDLLMEEAQDAVDELADLISTHCYTGNPAASPAQLSGADTMAVGNSYAGIDKTAITKSSEWEAQTATMAAASLDFDTLRANLIRPFKDACGLWPEFITCDGATFDRIGSLFGSDRRYVDTVQTQAQGVVNLKLRGGFKALEVDGIPIIEDKHATANKLYAWHSSSASFRQLPTAPSAMVPADRIQATMKMLTGTTIEPDVVADRLRSGDRRLQPSIHPLAKLGDSERIMVKLFCQLRHKYRSRHAQLTLT